MSPLSTLRACTVWKQPCIWVNFVSKKHCMIVNRPRVAPPPQFFHGNKSEHFVDCTSDDIAVWKTTRATATDDSAAYVADAIEKDQTGGSTSDAVPKLKRRAALPVSLLDRFRRYQLHRLRRHQARLQKMQRFRLSRHRVQTAMPLLKSCV
jgi:hypothetical protein